MIAAIIGSGYPETSKVKTTVWIDGCILDLDRFAAVVGWRKKQFEKRDV
jgi:hypothetical protein